MKSTRTPPAAIIAEDATPTDRVRSLLAFSLCVDSVNDDDLLALWPSLDLVEAIMICESALKIPEIEDEHLLRCSTIGKLAEVIVSSAPVSTVVE